MTRSLRLLSAILLIFLAARPGDCLLQGAAAEGFQAENQNGPLLDLNASFRAAYAKTRAKTLATCDPLILVQGDDLILLRGGKRSAARVVPDLYHTLKTVSHVPLAVYVMLGPLADQAMEGPELEALESYRARVISAARALEAKGLEPALLARLQQMLGDSVAFLDRVLAARRIGSADLIAFTRKMGPAVLVNARDAARAELDGLRRQMAAWRQELSPAEWSRLKVVIMGAALPREGNLATQFFAQQFEVKGEGERIIYAESLFDEPKALQLLGTNILDRAIGAAFFDDDQRMLRDLLADAARELLEKP